MGEETKKESIKIVPPKEFLYKDPVVKIGSGKFGPVNLIIHQGKLYAHKIVEKTSIDKPKRIEHVKNEKAILMLLRKHNQENGLESVASTRMKRRDDAESELSDPEN